jgi:hypothetical protein
VNRYGEYYSGQRTTQSAVDLKKITSLAEGISKFATSMDSYWTQIKGARALTQEYYYRDHADLYHFADLISQMVPDSTIQNNANAVKAKIKEAIIAEWHGPFNPNSHGLAIYFPEDNLSSHYNGNTIDFPKDTTWDEFLKVFITKKVVPMPRIQRVAIRDLNHIDVYFDGPLPDGITPLLFKVMEAGNPDALVEVRGVRVSREREGLAHLETSPLIEGRFYIVTLNKTRGIRDIPDTSLEFGIIRSGVISKERTRIEIPPGTFDGYIAIHIEEDPSHEKIKEADRTAYSRSRIEELLPGTIREIIAYDWNGEPLSPSHFKKSVALRIPYDDRHHEQDELFFRIFYLDEAESRWVLVPGSHDVDYRNNTVTAHIRHFSYYRVAKTSGTPAQDLDDVKVYPNPYKPSEPNHEYIIFENLTDDVRIRVFNIVGELVYEKELDLGGVWSEWKGENEDGEPLASGIYIYIITNDEGDVAKGKISIIK